MKTHKQYELELFEKEIDFMPLEQYTLGKVKILHECINGHQFYESPTNILRGRGCIFCSSRGTTKTKTTEQHIKDLSIKNSNFVLKEGQSYINNKSPLIYVCANGHELSFRPSDVLAGYGCIHCVPRGRYTNTYFERFPSDAIKSGILYIAKLSHSDNSFIKVGITVGSTQSDLKKRIVRYNKYSPVVLFAGVLTLKEAFDIEQNLLSMYKKYKYNTDLKFPGHTELLDIKIISNLLITSKTLLTTCRILTEVDTQ